MTRDVVCVVEHTRSSEGEERDERRCRVIDGRGD